MTQDDKDALLHLDSLRKYFCLPIKKVRKRYEKILSYEKKVECKGNWYLEHIKQGHIFSF